MHVRCSRASSTRALARSIAHLPSPHPRATTDHRHPIANRSSAPAAANTCITVSDPLQPHLGECGVGLNSVPCPTATEPSAWCNNPLHPGRLTVAWCMATFCNQCGHFFGTVYGGCVNGVQVATPVCNECGHQSVGPCQPGVLANDATCRPTGSAIGSRLSLRANIGCMANHCTLCGGLNTQPCNNGDGLRICDADFGPYKCVARAPLCRRSLLCLILRRLLAPTNDAGSRDCFLLTSRSRAPLRRSAFRRPASSSAGSILLKTAWRKIRRARGLPSTGRMRTR